MGEIRIGPSGLPDMSYGTGIELRLPANWNRRLLFQGGGGLNGVLLPVRRIWIGHYGRHPLQNPFVILRRAA